jgi:hypothetical protein
MVLTSAGLVMALYAWAVLACACLKLWLVVPLCVQRPGRHALWAGLQRPLSSHAGLSR